MLRLTNMRASQNRKAGNPGPEGSIAKLMFAEVNKRIYELCIDLLGADALVGYDYTMRRAEGLGLVGPAGVGPQDVHPVAGQLDRGRARPRSSATSSGSGSSGCPVTSGSTRSCPGRRCPAVDARARVTDARQFLGMEPMGDDLHWRLTVVPELTTPGKFLFGGCGLGAALVALEAASGRPTVWSTAQYLSYAPTHSVLDLR